MIVSIVLQMKYVPAKEHYCLAAAEVKYVEF